MADDGYNWFLIVITIVVTILATIANVYILVYFQHPEDRNQAWFPKFVVIAGLTLSELSILMFPLDVGNRAACTNEVSLSSCNFALPMREMWYAIYLTLTVLVAIVIPLTIFYYEADSEKSCFGRWFEASQWVLLSTAVIGTSIGIAYGLAGFVDYEVEELVSGMAPLSSEDLDTASECISLNPTGDTLLGGYQCDGARADSSHLRSWSLRPSFPVYVMALASACGWVLLMVFAGVGVSALPLDLIKAWVYRPRAVLTKTQYLHRAKDMYNQSKELEDEIKKSHAAQSSEGKSRAWKKRVKELNRQVAALEEQEAELAELYPQGEDPDTAWALTVMGQWLSLFLGVMSFVVSLLWVLHIILYMFNDPPVTPFLNTLFKDLDQVFSLFGTAAFALFCFYLLCCVIKGNMTLGLNFLVFTVHPMRAGGTVMSSLLFNVALISLAAAAVLQFTAQAFDGYANETEIHQIFGVQIESLRGIKYLFTHYVFLYGFFAIALLSLLVTAATGVKAHKKAKNKSATNAVDVLSICAMKSFFQEFLSTMAISASLHVTPKILRSCESILWQGISSTTFSSCVDPAHTTCRTSVNLSSLIINSIFCQSPISHTTSFESMSTSFYPICQNE